MIKKKRKHCRHDYPHIELQQTEDCDNPPCNGDVDRTNTDNDGSAADEQTVSPLSVQGLDENKDEEEDYKDEDEEEDDRSDNAAEESDLYRNNYDDARFRYNSRRRKVKITVVIKFREKIKIKFQFYDRITYIFIFNEIHAFFLFSSFVCFTNYHL